MCFKGGGGSGLKKREGRIREAERAAPRAAELLTLHEGTVSSTLYDFDDARAHPGRPHVRARSQCTPSRLGADGPLVARPSGWFAHLAGSTSELTRQGLALPLGQDTAPDRSMADIWLMGVKLPGWGPPDEARVAAAASTSISHHHSTTTCDPIAPPDPGPWPAGFHAAFHAQVQCTYRVGFEPIRGLLSLTTLLPSLSVLAPASASASNSHAAPGRATRPARATRPGARGTRHTPTGRPRTHKQAA
ncbi:hypothetical protein B0H10DRAFT_2230629 [Mycena sp. CBHHK59/15]|nr:hypothetical protein B0H10DRAFT_2230629 [Mycena sp. CBHHK59/15]